MQSSTSEVEAAKEKWSPKSKSLVAAVTMVVCTALAVVSYLHWPTTYTSSGFGQPVSKSYETYINLHMLTITALAVVVATPVTLFGLLYKRQLNPVVDLTLCFVALVGAWSLFMTVVLLPSGLSHILT